MDKQFGKTVFENENYLVLDKKSGILSTDVSPFIVHRLDRDTSGLLIVAKGERGKKKLQKLFKQRKIKKFYKVLVLGNIKESHGRIEGFVVRDKKDYKKRRFISAIVESLQQNHKKLAISQWRVLKRYHQPLFKNLSEEEFNHFTLLKIEIFTGRTHQIRVQMASLHHPVVGDRLYGGKRMRDITQKLGKERLFLHAYVLRFVDPWDEEVKIIKSKLPKDFSEQLNILSSN